MVFPEYRPRRLRRNKQMRSLIRETRLSSEQFIYPLFVLPGKGVKEQVSSMPGVYRLSVDQLAKEAKELLSLGLIMLSFLVCRPKKTVSVPVHMLKTA